MVRSLSRDIEDELWLRILDTPQSYRDLIPLPLESIQVCSSTAVTLEVSLTQIVWIWRIFFKSQIYLTES
jgi:hypothetical protein